jgi:predicted house-cleaning noncanonical NTP pyrophosphatase (MazG superfamily)
MRKEYNKLVRDRIPEIIRGGGSTCHVVTLSEHEYRHALLTKLVEEAAEAREAVDAADHLLTELADLYEVIDALVAAYGLDPQEVTRVRAERRAERGGFEQRICLVWTE